MCHADYYPRTLEKLAMLKSEILLDQRFVELTKAFGRLVHCFRKLNLVCSTFVVEVKVFEVILLAEEIEEWLFISG